MLGSIVEVAIRYDVPSAVPRPDETENCSGEGGIAENAGMINRIDSVQAARLHKPAALARVVAAGRPSSGRDAENSWGGDDSKRDESHLSTHGGFLPFPDVTRWESMARLPTGKGGLGSMWAYVERLCFRPLDDLPQASFTALSGR